MIFISFIDNFKKAKPIFNGIIHECLRLESILDLDLEAEEGPKEQEGDDKDPDSFLQVLKDSEKIFCSEFYFIFGESLRILAEFEMIEEDIIETSLEQVKGLLSAAIDRFQLSSEKKSEDQEQVSFNTDLKSGIVYSMASLCVLIKDNEILKNELKKLIYESDSSANNSNYNFKDVIRSSMFDAIEFFCAFIEAVFEKEYEFEDTEIIEDYCKYLETNISIIEEVCELTESDSDLNKLKLIRIDVPLRLAFARSIEITVEISTPFLEKLDELLLLSSSLDSDIRYEALQLKASIKESMGFENEANKIYKEAECIKLE